MRTPAHKDPVVLDTAIDITLLPLKERPDNEAFPLQMIQTGCQISIYMTNYTQKIL